MILKRSTCKRGFSLIEVVIAIGVFAATILGIVGLQAPIGKYARDVVDGNTASNIVGVIVGELNRLPYSTVSSFTAAKLYSTSSGDKISRTLGSGASEVPQDEAYFRADLNLDNQSTSAFDGYLEFTVTLRWPEYLPNGEEYAARQRRFVVFKTVVPQSR